ncbi:hypothetical protein ACOQFL_18765 [Actinopolyspora sp. H202]|uniref:hypothetical protein n=1 Tax=Actinopolyspora sp. H202 TaxID=1500456 RepID=UPI003EE50673
MRTELILASAALVAALPWAVVLYDLPRLEQRRARNRARRTTRRMWERYPESRPKGGVL